MPSYQVSITLDTTRGHDVLRLQVRVERSPMDIQLWRYEIALNGPYSRIEVKALVRLAFEDILRELCHDPTAILGDTGRMAYLPAEREILQYLAGEEYKAILSRYPE